MRATECTCERTSSARERIGRGVLAALTVLVFGACGSGEALNPEELETLEGMVFQDTLAPSPSNDVAV